MLSKAKIKWIHSLEQKKFRMEYRLFVSEGNKLTSDLLPLLHCRFLAASTEWLKLNKPHADEVVDVSRDELSKLSNQPSPQDVVAVFEMPSYQIDVNEIKQSLSLALDNIQDPGNLGTIIRIADWFGIENILCSIGTADAFNPKTIQASMGAIGRVKIHYLPLFEFFKQIDLPIYGTFLEGENIYQCSDLLPQGIVLMGNEGNGISKELAGLVSKKLFIPNYPANRHGSESLNVSTATAIVCSEFRRRG